MASNSPSASTLPVSEVEGIGIPVIADHDTHQPDQVALLQGFPLMPWHRARRSRKSPPHASTGLDQQGANAASEDLIAQQVLIATFVVMLGVFGMPLAFSFLLSLQGYAQGQGLFSGGYVGLEN